MKSFATTVKGLKSFSIVAKLKVLDVCEDPDYASDSMSVKNSTHSKELELASF